MSKLAEYRAKRHFMRTPEPFGVEGPSDPDNLTFVIQQHAASRDHFDLRLEWDGVLMSWAVPEGPSVRTRDKRLAITTEDHPLDYAEFQGKIPEGEYGAGEIIVWDRGIWVPVTEPVDEALEAGELKFRLAGEKLKGGWTLVKLPKGDTEWLFIKERDPGVRDVDILAEAPGPVLKKTRARKPGKAANLPDWVKPQLATAEPAPPESGDWLHEIKYDGYRTTARIDGDDIRLITRNGHDWTEKYGSIADALSELDCQNAMLDGEIIVQDGRGASSFAELQKALADRRDGELIFYVFDLLYLNGRDLQTEPLTVRKEWLRRLLPDDPEFRVQFSDHSDGEGRELFGHVCRLGLEGVVSKRLDAPYRSGRSTDWIKAKRYDVGRFSVVGFTTQASSRHVASLMLAEEESGDYVGRASAGLSNDWAADLFERLSGLESPDAALDIPPPKNAHWLPAGEVVAEIAFRGRTGTGAVRQASILSVQETTPAAARPARAKKLVTDRDLASIRLTNPDREVFEGSGASKLDIALYYARVGDAMLPYLLDRPVTLIRCTTGKLEDCFYQRHAIQGMPDGIDVVGDPEIKEYLVIRDARGFLGLTQFGVIEFHPWDCRADDLTCPDRFTIDLDPGEDVGWPSVLAGALQMRDRLASVGLTAFPRVTGGKGLHLVVPLNATQEWAPVKEYLRALAKAAEADAPKLFVTSSKIADRAGRIYLDMNRTSRGTSAVASFSLRSKINLPAAVPMGWAELQQSSKLPVFDRKKTVFRVERGGDPWEGIDDARAEIGKSARRDAGI